MNMPRKRRPEERPREILEAALDLFSQNGFAATRLEDVAKRAGLSKAAIYLYFEDKSALLKGIIEAFVTSNIAQVQAVAASHQGPTAPLLREILLLLGNRIQTTRLPDLLKIVISEARAHPEVGRLYIENVLSKALPLLASLIARGIASGEFRVVDPDLTAKCFVGPMVLAGIWRGVFHPIGAPPLDAEALARQHADLILTSLLASPRSAGPD